MQTHGGFCFVRRRGLRGQRYASRLQIRGGPVVSAPLVVSNPPDFSEVEKKEGGVWAMWSAGIEADALFGRAPEIRLHWN